MLEYKIFTNILLYSIVPTLIALYVTQRIKGSIKNSFDKKLEEVKKEHSKEITQFQTELNYLKSKENFKFTKLHEKRLTVLAKTYQHINENLSLLQNHVSQINVNNENSINEDLPDENLQAYSNFVKYFDSNAIYFDEYLEKLINNFFDEVGDIYMDFGFHKTNLSILNQPNENLNTVVASSKAHIRIKLFPIKREIESKFRELLGE